MQSPELEPFNFVTRNPNTRDINMMYQRIANYMQYFIR
jgi:hypothetical protein